MNEDGTLRNKCRSCESTDLLQIVDYGQVPLGSSLVSKEQVNDKSYEEKKYPLRAVVCENCTLMQLDFDVNAEELFVKNYHYRASYSDAILDHAKELSTSLVTRYGLDSDDLLVEIGSNDGYFLRWLNDAEVKTLGIDPSPGPAKDSLALGIPTINAFFDKELAKKIVKDYSQAKLVFLSNVLSHVRDTDSVIEGIDTLLAQDGVLIIENPWVKDLVDENQFDMIYHEHACYFSCHSLEAFLNKYGLYLNDAQYVDDLHGGMLIWHASRKPSRSKELQKYFQTEKDARIDSAKYYFDFGNRIEDVKQQIAQVVESIIEDGGTIAAYGAVAKGVTLLQALGLTNEHLSFCVDRNPDKIGKYLPSSLVEIKHVDELEKLVPDVVLLLAWNYKKEIASQQRPYLENGGAFLVPVPEIEFIGNQLYNPVKIHEPQPT